MVRAIWFYSKLATKRRSSKASGFFCEALSLPGELLPRASPRHSGQFANFAAKKMPPQRLFPALFLLLAAACQPEIPKLDAQALAQEPAGSISVLWSREHPESQRAETLFLSLDSSAYAYASGAASNRVALEVNAQELAELLELLREVRFDRMAADSLAPAPAPDRLLELAIRGHRFRVATGSAGSLPPAQSQPFDKAFAAAEALGMKRALLRQADLRLAPADDTLGNHWMAKARVNQRQEFLLNAAEERLAVWPGQNRIQLTINGLDRSWQLDTVLQVPDQPIVRMEWALTPEGRLLLRSIEAQGD